MPRPIGGSSTDPSVRRTGEPRRSTPASFTPDGTLSTKVKEASDMVGLPDGRLLVVSDTSAKAALVAPDGKVTSVELSGLGHGDSQLEAVTYDPVREHLLVVREESRELVRYEWAADGDEAPKLERTSTLPMPTEGRKNKGVEGLAYLSGDVSPTGRPQLVAAHEGKPKQLFVVDDVGGGKARAITLDDQVREVMRDFSALAVDPLTGDLFLASDESSMVAQLRLEVRGGALTATLVHAFPVRDGRHSLDRIEGLAFSPEGDLLVLTENDGKVHRYARDA